MKLSIVRAMVLLVAMVLLSAAPVRAAEEAALPEGVPAPPEGAPPPDAPPPGSAPPPASAAPPDDARSAGRTPLRLSFVDGSVSFWRPGADDWAPAQINTPLAPGDALYTAAAANLELQIGPRAFLRAGAGTQLSLENQEFDFLQFKVPLGHVSLDLRSIPAAHRIEIDTPNAVFTVDHTGYYRVDVDAETTTFTTRRGGYAAMTPAGGQGSAISPGEQVVIAGTESPVVQSYVAPEPDSWDRWNYDRSDHLIDAVSARYVPPGVYGADALDNYGNWRVVGNYGPVWVPEGVAPTWAPYSTGRWIWDPYYAWTWVDTAPWGWAPYHYGRWVYIGSYWAWAPGPLVVAPVYSPALVAFFGGSGFGVRVGAGVPPFGWVALGWGEPCTPWWGRPGFAGRPWWGGWGGPHVINNTVISNTTIITVNQIHTYHNVRVHDAVVAVPRDRFGRGGVASVRLWKIDPHRLQPIHGRVPVKPSPASLLPASGRGLRPPESVLQRRVVGTRPSHDPTLELRSAGLQRAPSRAPEPRLVPAPRRPQSSLGQPRPASGPAAAPERARPSLPPRVQENVPQESAPRHAPARATGQPPPRHPAPPLLTNQGVRPEGARGTEPRPVAPRPAVPPGVPARRAPQAQAPQIQPPQGAAPRVEPPHGGSPSDGSPRVMPPRGASQRSAPPRVEILRGGPSSGGPPRVMPPRRAPQRSAAPPVSVPQVQRPQPPPRPLPGEPANRVYPGQGGGQPRQFNAPVRAPVAPYAPAPVAPYAPAPVAPYAPVPRGGGGIGR